MASPTQVLLAQVESGLRDATGNAQRLAKQSEDAAAAAQSKLEAVKARGIPLEQAVKEAQAEAKKAQDASEQAQRELVQSRQLKQRVTDSIGNLRAVRDESSQSQRETAAQIQQLERNLQQAAKAAEEAQDMARAAMERRKEAQEAYEAAVERHKKAQLMPACIVGQAKCRAAAQDELSSATGARDKAVKQRDETVAESRNLSAESAKQKREFTQKKQTLESQRAEFERTAATADRDAEQAARAATEIRSEVEQLETLTTSATAASQRAQKAVDDLKTINIVRPRIALTYTDTDQYVEVWFEETNAASHPFLRGGRVKCDLDDVKLAPSGDPFDTRVDNGELKPRKRLPFTVDFAGNYTFTHTLEDPADPMVLVEDNPVNERLNLPEPVLKVYLDEDRDGAIDAAPAHVTDWGWGDAGRGGILLVKTREYAAANAEVVERRPIDFKWEEKYWQSWTATLQIAPAAKVRVYKTNQEGAPLLLGQGGPACFDLHADNDIKADLEVRKKSTLWIEAVSYPNDADEAAWRVALTFNFRHKNPAPEQKAVVRIAPWIMASDLDPTRKVYIIDFTNQDQIKNGPTRVLNTQLRGDLPGLLGGPPLQTVTTASKVRYLRDVMRFGTQTAPGGANRAQRVVLRGNNKATSLTIPKTGIARDADEVGYIEQGNPSETDLETGGNMMVSPPTPEYPFGRIVCGSPAVKGGLPNWRPFLSAQRLQKPVLIDTSWLNVGHSDEIIAFVPACAGSGTGGGNFRMLIASPRRAYRILCEAVVDLTALAVQAMNSAQQDADAAREWAQRIQLEGGNPIDFQAWLGGIDLSHANGRFGYRRFDNFGNPNQRSWIHQFFYDDPLLDRLVNWPVGGRDALAAAGKAHLQALFNDVSLAAFRTQWIGAATGNVFTSIAGKVGRNDPFDQFTENEIRKVKLFLKKVLAAREPAFPAVGNADQPAAAEFIGKTYLIDLPEIVDRGKARVWLTRAASPLLARFPQDDDYRRKTIELFDSLAGIAAGVPDPTEGSPDDPPLNDIINGLVARYGIGPLGQDAIDGLLHRNLILQLKLDKIRNQVRDAIAIADGDIIEAPMLYHNYVGANTLVGDMVNFVMLNRAVDDPLQRTQRPNGCTCIVPKPHGPIVGGIDLFEGYFRNQLTALGITAHFIDEWYEYHLNNGEIHCGTNQLPDDNPRKWWLREPH